MPVRDPEKKREAYRRWQAANLEKHRDKMRRYREANPAMAPAVAKRWRDAHPEAARAWSRANPQRVRELNRQWQQEHPERIRELSHQRRARLRGALVAPVNEADIFTRDNWICQLCNEPVDPDLRYPNQQMASLDHVVPLSKGGTHEPDNVQLAHLRCNEAKGARTSR